MKYSNYYEFEEELEVQYLKKKYHDALNLVENAKNVLTSEEFEKYTFSILYYKAMLYSKCEMYDNCVDTLVYLINQGYVLPLHYDSFLKALEDDKRNKELKEKNALLRHEVQEKTQLKFAVYLPENYSEDKKYPLFFNLHGDGLGGTIEEHMRYWKPDILLERNFIVVYLQSSQFLCENGYAWLKRVFNSDETKEILDAESIYEISEACYLLKECYESAYDEVRSCYMSLLKVYSIDENCILIGGMSGGATATVDFTMADIIPITGFIALCPELKPKSFTKDSVKRAMDRGVKGVFMEGEHGTIVDDEKKMVRIFEEVGFSYEFYINKGIGHAYPEDLDNKVKKALDFILNES